MKKSQKAAVKENKQLLKQVEALREDAEEQMHVEKICEEERRKTSQVSKRNQEQKETIAALQTKLQQLQEMTEDISDLKSE